MSNQLHNELKKEFQLERMILFSDAVFAIAITLLVIEIKIPDIHGDVSDKLLLEALGHLIPKFIGFFVSFMLIGLYWTVHHRLFGFVTSYNRKLIWLNLFFLFFIALMPFSTGFYSEYAGNELFLKQIKVPMTFYVLNYFFAGVMNYLLWQYVSNPKHKLTEPAIDPVVLKMAKARSLIVPLVSLLMLPVAYLIDIRLAVYVPMMIPLIMSFFRKVLTKKYNVDHKILKTPDK
jgi:uncharacterized membrane protein